MDKNKFKRDLASFRRQYQAGTKRLDNALQTLQAADDPLACSHARLPATISTGTLSVQATRLFNLLVDHCMADLTPLGTGTMENGENQAGSGARCWVEI